MNETGVDDPVPGRHDDRVAAGRAARRRDRRERRVLQLRHQRSDADRRSASRATTPASFIGAYQKAGIFAHDPFVTLDTDGVGELMRIAAERGRATRPGHQARHLRRAWRRPGLDPFLPRGRARLRVVLALPRADRPPRRRPGRAGRRFGRRPAERRSAACPTWSIPNSSPAMSIASSTTRRSRNCPTTTAARCATITTCRTGGESSSRPTGSAPSTGRSRRSRSRARC